MKNFKYAVYYFFFFSIYAVVTPNIQLFFSQLGFDYDQIGILQAVYQIVGIAAPLLFGPFVDRTRYYKYALLVCLIGTVPFFWGMTRGGSFTVILILVVLAGLMMRPTVSLSDAFLSHSFDNPEHQYGRIRPAGSIGFLVGALILDFTHLFNRNMVPRFFWSIAVTVGLTLIVLFFLPRASHFSPQDQGSGGRDRDESRPIPPFFWLVMGAATLGWLGQTAYFSFYSLYVKAHTGITTINVLWALGALFEIPFLFFSGNLVKRWGFKPLFLISLGSVSVRLLLYAGFSADWAQYAGQLIHSVSFGLFHGICVAFINRYTPRHRKGSGLAFYTAVVRSASAFIGSFAGGYIAKAFDIPFLFAVYSLVPVIGIIMLLFWKEKRKIYITGEKTAA